MPRSPEFVVAARLHLDEVVERRVAAVDAERELADAALALEDTGVDLGLRGVRGLDLEVRVTADLHALAVRRRVVEHRRAEALRVVELQVPVRDEVLDDGAGERRASTRIADGCRARRARPGRGRRRRGSASCSAATAGRRTRRARCGRAANANVSGQPATGTMPPSSPDRRSRGHRHRQAREIVRRDELDCVPRPGATSSCRRASTRGTPRRRTGRAACGSARRRRRTAPPTR